MVSVAIGLLALLFALRMVGGAEQNAPHRAGGLGRNAERDGRAVLAR
ncbi:hypothetical protein ACL58G_17440 [Massilia sp. GER05]